MATFALMIFFHCCKNGFRETYLLHFKAIKYEKSILSKKKNISYNNNVYSKKILIKYYEHFKLLHAVIYF